ncbi:MAG: sulfotransferase [Pseudomonadota bacterium]
MPRMPQQGAPRAPLKPGAQRPDALALADIQRDLDAAVKAHQAGDVAAAEKGYRAVLERAPHQPDALNLLGVIRAERQELDAALDYLEAAARRRPKDPNILNNLGHATLRARQHERAIDALERAVALKPDFIEAYGNLVQALRASGQSWRAEAAIRLMRGVKDGSVLADMEEARLRTDVGDRDAASDVLRRLLGARPDHGAAWQLLSTLRKWRAGDPEIDALLKQIDAAEAAPQRLKPMCYAAGKIFDDLGEYDRAFSFFERANAQDKDVVYDHQATLKAHDDIRRAIDLAFYEERADWGSPSRRPVFIVGMPRSGTTLTEQILASHPDVHGGGELEYVANVRSDLALMVPKEETYPRALRSLTKPGAEALAWRYLARLESLDRIKARVTDKMPHNFIALGLLALIFPQASFIHCVRHPFDTCFSCWQRDFAASHAYNRSLRDLGRYYQAYRELMEFYEEVLPLSIFTADYDALVADQTERSRALVAHAGLDWSDTVLDFHKTERRVATPSNMQVRQPLYATSSHRWRNYEKHLGPLFETIDARFLPQAP